MTFSEADRNELQMAKALLENPGLAAKITHVIGTPIEKGIKLLPAGWNKTIADLTQTALLKAAEVALFTLKDRPDQPASKRWHKLGVAVSGGVGGFFGLAAITAELPLSTTIMLRSIADIARSQGESMAARETQLACLEVFALGGSSPWDDGTESGYYAIRVALAKSLADATEFLARKTLTEESAPALMRLVAKIAERFGLQVTEKVAAQAVPLIGATGGALINTLFLAHFQAMAQGHFIVRKLERKYGKEPVAQLYAALSPLG